MKKRTALIETAAEDDLLVDLTFHDIPIILITKFAEKIVRPYYRGNLNQALKDLIEKAVAEQDFLLNHVEKQILQ
jgi:alanine-alpha-ketoisovalerate/valine-pyruvate aminotransferase